MAAGLREMGGPEPGAGVLSSLTGLDVHCRRLPTDESVGYFRASLRDGGDSGGARPRRRYVPAGTSDNSPPFQRWAGMAGKGKPRRGERKRRRGFGKWEDRNQGQRFFRP